MGPRPDQPIVVGMRDDIRETLITHSLDAEPSSAKKIRGQASGRLYALWRFPELSVGSIFTPWAVPIGAPPVIVTLIGWLWPRGHSPTPALSTGRESWSL